MGLEITHSTDGLYITQVKYASELLSRAGLTDSKTVDTPVELKAVFELAVNGFRKSFFVKSTCLAATENRIFRKMILV